MREIMTASLALFFLQGIFAQHPADTVFTKVDTMPCFFGCALADGGTQARQECSGQALVQFISKYLVYPPEARQSGLEGTVYVSFIVDEEGLVTQTRVVRDIGGGCSGAALDLLREMPRWEPGMQNGQAVKVRLNLPIQFSLRDKDVDLAGGYSLTWGTLKGGTMRLDELKKNISKPLYVRDPFGNNRYIDELAFTFEKNKRLHNAVSRGEISSEMIKIIDKSKKGGKFTITASVQDNGRFIYVSRTFKIVD
jgi:TonB family protein